MPNCISFAIDGLPIAKGRARAFRVGNFIRHHTPKKTENYEAWARGCAAAAMEGREPIAGPLRMVIEFVLPVPASWPAWKRQAALAGFVKPTGRPDLDNMAKAVKDACNSVVYRDDSQVVFLALEKSFGQPRAEVHVEQLQQIASAAEWKNLQREGAEVAKKLRQTSADLFGGAPV